MKKAPETFAVSYSFKTPEHEEREYEERRQQVEAQVREHLKPGRKLTVRTPSGDEFICDIEEVDCTNPSDVVVKLRKVEWKSTQ